MDNDDFDWNECYTGEASDLEPPDPLVLELIGDLPPGRALDIGCGAGGLLMALAERGHRVTGIDVAGRAIEAAKKAAAARHFEVELHCGDATKWKPPGQYDLIVSTFAMPGDVDGRARVFEMARGALAPGGTLVLKDFDASMRSRHPHFATFDSPTVDELESAFDGLEILRSEVVDTPPHDHGGNDSHLVERWTAAILHARKPA